MLCFSEIDNVFTVEFTSRTKLDKQLKPGALDDRFVLVSDSSEVRIHDPGSEDSKPGPLVSRANSQTLDH